MYFLYNAAKMIQPLVKRNNLYCYLFMLFYLNVLKGLKTIFVNCVYCFDMICFSLNSKEIHHYIYF